MLWTAILLLFAILNWKVLPFVWHLRLLTALVYPFFIRRKVYNPATDGALLFKPIVTASRSPIFECDYNMHKSNSTFFTDLDIVRVDLIARLFGGGLATLSKTGAGQPDRKMMKSVIPVLGGVHCSFRREIAPYARYEMWTRVLCWDRKWLYVVTYFVRPRRAQRTQLTAAKPADGNGLPGGLIKDLGVAEQLLDRNILATAITKYVLKAGRVTVPPERLLEASGLLAVELGADEGGKEGWNRVRVEQERIKGLELAEAFGSLDGLHSTFSKDNELGKKS